MIVSDVCNTLYDSNTTFDFIQYVVEKENENKKLSYLKSLKIKYSFNSVYGYLANRLFNIDYSKNKAIGFLKGISKTKLESYALDFYNEVLIHKEIDQVFKKLIELENNDLILASASIEPIVKIIAQKINAKDYVSTTLKYDNNNIAIGEILEEAKGQKLELLKKKSLINGSFTFISDNFSDIEIMKESKQPIAVVYNQKGTEYWDTVGCELITIDNDI